MDIKTIQLSEKAPHQSMGAAQAYQTGDLATIFYDGESYGYCYHGVSRDGNAYEGDDVTGFATAEEAEADARDNYGD